MARGGPFRPENDTSKRCMSFAVPPKSFLIERLNHLNYVEK
jgi:hypothetical protein